jgi:uncharacterized damage-inducible protein DinB
MPAEVPFLSSIFDGWDTYQTSIFHAIQPLTPEQLAWRPAPDQRSVGQLTSHIALGRVYWFARMPAPGSTALEQKILAMGGTSAAEESVANDRALLLEWLEASWQMIADTLTQWTAADLARTYQHEYWGKTYLVSYQWTIWRIMSHDIHHGGALALMLGLQHLQVPELGDLFGHLTEPPVVE